MRALIACTIALAMAIAASAEVVIGPPPSHPPIPPLLGASGSWVFRGTTLTNAHRDSVILDADSLTTEAMISSGKIWAPASARSVTLKDGSTLRLDDKTQAGEYVLADGSKMQVLPGTGYPRTVEAEASRTLSLRFRVCTGARVGVLLTTLGTPPTPEGYLKTLASGRGLGRPFAQSDVIAALECSEDGPTVNEVRLDPARTTPVEVAWYAYGSDPSVGPQPKASGLQREGDRVEWKASRSPGVKSYPLALTRDVPVSAGELRLVGRVLIDPVRNTVTRTK